MGQCLIFMVFYWRHPLKWPSYAYTKSQKEPLYKHILPKRYYLIFVLYIILKEILIVVFTFNEVNCSCKKRYEPIVLIMMIINATIQSWNYLKYSKSVKFLILIFWLETWLLIFRMSLYFFFFFFWKFQFSTNKNMGSKILKIT